MNKGICRHTICQEAKSEVAILSFQNAALVEANQTLRAELEKAKRFLELSEKGLKLGINISENWEKAYRISKTEAVKEFAERLKERSCFYDHDDSFSFRAVLVEDIDNLVKEMTEEKE